MNKKEYSKLRKSVSNPTLLDELRQPYLDALQVLHTRSYGASIFAAANIGRGIERLANTPITLFLDFEECKRVKAYLSYELYGLLRSLVRKMRNDMMEKGGK